MASEKKDLSPWDISGMFNADRDRRMAYVPFAGKHMIKIEPDGADDSSYNIYDWFMAKFPKKQFQTLRKELNAVDLKAIKAKVPSFDKDVWGDDEFTSHFLDDDDNIADTITAGLHDDDNSVTFGKVFEGVSVKDLKKVLKKILSDEDYKTILPMLKEKPISLEYVLTEGDDSGNAEEEEEEEEQEAEEFGEVRDDLKNKEKKEKKKPKKQPSAWALAVGLAYEERKARGITGFEPLRTDSAIYNEAKEIYNSMNNKGKKSVTSKTKKKSSKKKAASKKKFSKKNKEASVKAEASISNKKASVKIEADVPVASKKKASKKKKTSVKIEAQVPVASKKKASKKKKKASVKAATSAASKKKASKKKASVKAATSAASKKKASKKKTSVKAATSAASKKKSSKKKKKASVKAEAPVASKKKASKKKASIKAEAPAPSRKRKQAPGRKASKKTASMKKTASKKKGASRKKKARKN